MCLKDETSIVSIYIDDFLLASNTMIIFKGLKIFFLKKYNIKDFKNVKTIIG